jgi:hypothetical protein
MCLSSVVLRHIGGQLHTLGRLGEATVQRSYISSAAKHRDNIMTALRQAITGEPRTPPAQPGRDSP